MSFKTTLVALVVLAALGAYVYKYEREPVPAETDSEKEKVFASLEADKIREVELRHPEAETVKLEKSGEDWKLTEPLEAPADKTEVEALTRNLASLERDRVIAEWGKGTDTEAPSLDDFGLAEPRLDVRFSAEGLENPVALQIGKKTPTGSNLYAKLEGEGRVFVIASYLESNFDKKAWDLRDKSLFHFDRNDVEKVVLKQPGGELVLAKGGEDVWNVTTPSFCRADRYKASGLVSRLESGKMEEIVSESAVDQKTLAEYGLSHPRYEVEIQLAGGRSAQLLVGDEKSGRYYARNADRPLVFLIGSTLVDDIKKDASEYRSKRLFDFATYQVDKFQIAPHGEAARVYVKEKPQEEGGQASWKQTAPEERELDRTKVEDLLYKLNGTDADSFAADKPASLASYGLDTPAFVITVWSKEEAVVEETSMGKPEGEKVYARRKGDDPVLELTSSSWGEIEKLMSFESEEKATDEKDTESPTN